MTQANSRPIEVVLNEARERQENPIFDSEEANKYLLAAIEQPLRRRAFELESQYWGMHGRLSALSQRLVDGEGRSAVRDQMRQLDRRRIEATAEMERLSHAMDHPSRDPRVRRQTMRAAERHLRVLNRLQSELRSNLARAEAENERFGNVVTELDQLWKSLSDAKSIATHLAASVAIASIRMRALRIVLLLFMLGLAFLVDRQTPAAEGLFRNADVSERHDLAILWLFLGQAQLVEPSVGWLKKISGWQVS